MLYSIVRCNRIVTQRTSYENSRKDLLVTIITDGYGNDSKEYNGETIMTLVDELKGKVRVFAYIDANHDVENITATISITNTLRFETISVGSSKEVE